MQLELINTDLSVNDVSLTANLTPILYKNVPCISTEALAKVYGAEEGQIRKNFASNRNRFTEGKHFYLLQGEELDALRNSQAKNLGSQNLQATFSNFQISPKTRRLTLWTERGAARHAKMLNSDKAWDVFEMLEETFFNQPAAPAPAPAPAEPVTFSTTAERLPLRNIVAVWASQSGQSFADCWRQLKAAFKLSSIKDMPSSWVVDAIDWVQAKIDNAAAASALPAASSAQALPPATDLPALPADTPKKAQYIECALREALSKLEYAYQLQNFYGTPDKACKGNEEHLKFLHISCMSNINAAAAITRALIALR